jgi:DNA-3-methyladenine glycosylase I
MLKPIVKKPVSYCQVVEKMDAGSVHRIYHNNSYGFRVKNDNELFERLILEINQAGLSWNTILNKQQNFKKAFENFNIKKVAAYKQEDRQRLLTDAGIIRNRLKIEAAIYNANTILALQKEAGSFTNWLDSNHPKTLEQWTSLFKKNFKFTGGEIVNEFLVSTGYLAGAHIEGCPIKKLAEKSKPAWMKK